MPERVRSTARAGELFGGIARAAVVAGERAGDGVVEPDDIGYTRLDGDRREWLAGVGRHPDDLDGDHVARDRAGERGDGRRETRAIDDGCEVRAPAGEEESHDGEARPASRVVCVVGARWLADHAIVVADALVGEPRTGLEGAALEVATRAGTRVGVVDGTANVGCGGRVAS